MLTQKDYERIAFEERLFSVTKYSLVLGLIVFLCLAVQKPLGKYLDMDNGDYKNNIKKEVVK